MSGIQLPITIAQGKLHGVYHTIKSKHHYTCITSEVDTTHRGKRK